MAQQNNNRNWQGANNQSAVTPYTANDVMVPDGFKENVELIIQTYAKDLTPQEFSLFAADAHSRGMSITKRQIYATKYKGKMTIMVGIDGYRSTAENHPDYAGQDGPYWCGTDGIWRDVWLSKDKPAAAKVGVYRKGFQAPLYGIALWSEYAKTDRDVWQSLPTIMLAKCAEAQAIRKAFPAKLGGTYIPEEMDRANAIETTARIVDRSTGEITDAPAVPSGQDRLNAWNTVNAALHAWADGVGITHDDLQNAAVSLSKGKHGSLADMSGVELEWLAERLREAYGRDPAKLAQWLDSIDPTQPNVPAPPDRPLTTEEAIEASLASATPAGDQLPGMDDPELERNTDRIAEAARA